MGVNIISAANFGRGFVLGGGNGELLVYEKNDDVDHPFKFQKKYVSQIERTTIEKAAITSIAINSTDDIFFISSNNLLRKLTASLDGTDDEHKF